MLGAFPFPGGAFGEIPQYRSVRPLEVMQSSAGTSGGMFLKYHAYSPGSRGTGDGLARTSDRDHSRSGLVTRSKIPKGILLSANVHNCPDGTVAVKHERLTTFETL